MKGTKMWLLIAFIAVPLIEIALFIQVGGWLGLWPTLGIVILTALAGSWLVRSQGSREMQNLRSSFSEMRDPSEPLAHGAMILFSGAMLLTPGFFTDILGLLLLVPSVRSALLSYLRTKIKVAEFSMGPSQPRNSGPEDGVIDADFEDLTDQHTDSPSGWTRNSR